MTELTAGMEAPDFTLESDAGTPVSLSALRGNGVVLYFYPKDNTPGCTAEACSLRDGYDALRSAGYEVIGVSKDSAASHGKFAAKHSLPFTLIADTDTTLNQAFGVWQKKKMAGREYMGTVRTTFLVDGDGIVTDIIAKVDTKNSASQILEIINKKA